MTSRRRERLASLYQQVISSFLERKVKIAEGIFSVTKVEVGDNLRELTIYFSAWPDEKAAGVLKSLQGASRELRAHLADKVKTKFAPELEFKLDESEKRRMEIEALLKKTK